MDNKFWCITSFFNPCGYKTLLSNYLKFAKKLKEQKVNLLTVELSFGDDEFYIPKSENVLQLRGKSVMWMKERLINHGLSNLPKSCEYFAWIDCDVLFSQNDWEAQLLNKLKTNNIIQLYKKIFYLPAETDWYDGSKMNCVQGIVWQKNIHKDWLVRRKSKNLPFSAPGFAWAANRKLFEDLGGIYDKNIVGSGDTFLVDCYFDSWEIHGYYNKLNERMKLDMMEWKDRLLKNKLSVDYLPIDIYHLWHGSLKNRNYMGRHEVITKYDLDPKKDVRLENGVYEWNSDKPEMHKSIEQYFYDRKEDFITEQENVWLKMLKKIKKLVNNSVKFDY